MRGFLVGTFALVVLSALLQKDAAGNLSQGTDAAAAVFRRLVDPRVAGIPLRPGVAGKRAAPRSATPDTGQTPGPGGILPGVPYRSGVTG